MMRLKIALAALIGLGMAGNAIGALPMQNDSAIRIAPVVPMKALPFSLSQVRLLDGPFKHAMEMDGKYLLELDADRLLSGFREVAGLPSKAKKYGGWESAGVAGHILGHYLSACSMMYQSTGDDRFKQRVDYIVDELSDCQKANGNGFLCAFSDGKRIFDEVGHGKIDVANGINGGWVPWYTLHKDYAGLRDAYLYTGNGKAKTVLIGFADWACDLSDRLTDDQFQKMLRAEHGGMNEVMADIYAITGVTKYLHLSERFNHKAVLEPLMNQSDQLNGLHANTQIPKVIGLARQFELTGGEQYRTGATFFWEEVTAKRSFANGGNSNYEHFFPIGKMGSELSTSSSETCNTYNMLKLTGHLFAWDPQARYIDYYERALYNHILPSLDPVTGGMTYYISLRSGTFKAFSSPFDSFWCCVGTGIENHSKYGGAIYSHDDNSLWVNLFIPSELNWEQKGMRIREETNFPEDGAVKLMITANSPTKAIIRVRHPEWARSQMTVAVNGLVVPQARGGSQPYASYIEMDRTWITGDTIAIALPMNIRAEPMHDDPTKVALFSGPILMAADLGSQNVPEPIAGNDQLMFSRLPVPHVPVLVTDNQPVDHWVEPVAGKPLTFKTTGVGKPGDITLIPFYKANRMRYAVYFDTFTAGAWATRQAAFEAGQRHDSELNAITLDVVRPGEQQPEHDHNLHSHDSNTGMHLDRGWRDASPTGWFSYTLVADRDHPSDLLCTYWGSETGNRNFNIEVDGQSIGSQQLNMNQPDQFFDVRYPIPLELSQGKQTITVKFVPNNNGMVGGLFGCRLVKR